MDSSLQIIELTSKSFKLYQAENFVMVLECLNIKNDLNKLQLWSLKLRIIQIRRAILKSLKNGKLVLLNDNEWNVKTVAKELSGDYGDTYLVQYSKKQMLNKEFNV